VWLAGPTLLGALVVARVSEPRPASLRLPGPVIAVCALAAIVSFGGSLRPHPRTYATVELERNVGAIVSDPSANGGRAMEARPDAGQEAGMLAITLPEIYGPGRYRLTISLRALPAGSDPDPSLRVADVRVFASEVERFAKRWDVRSNDLPADGQYHRFAFVFENPRQQALTFILDYPATAGLRADEILVEPWP